MKKNIITVIMICIGFIALGYMVSPVDGLVGPFDDFVVILATVTAELLMANLGLKGRANAKIISNDYDDYSM